MKVRNSLKLLALAYISAKAGNADEAGDLLVQASEEGGLDAVMDGVAKASEELPEEEEFDASVEEDEEDAFEEEEEEEEDMTASAKRRRRAKMKASEDEEMEEVEVEEEEDAEVEIPASVLRLAQGTKI